MIPDWAAVRDCVHRPAQEDLRDLCLGWQGTPRQWHRLETAMHIMAIVIVPVAVSVHTIVSWDFAMTPVPMWRSTIFGPYFVVGAIFSGIAALILAMALLRKFLHLEEYLQPMHFQNLGKLLLTMSLLWFYFTFAERLTTWYGNDPSEMAVFWTTIRQNFAPMFWTMVVCNFIIPVPILAIKKLRTITGTCIASVGIVVGMWIERFLIIVPALEHKFLPYCLWTLPPHLGGNHAHGLLVRPDGPALLVVLEVRAGDFRVGIEGRAAPPVARPRMPAPSVTVPAGGGCAR